MRNRTWFTSDWHLGHQNIIEFCDRPFSDIYEMSATLMARYMQSVAPDDDVYFLGDMAMGRVQDGLDTIAYLPGNKFLVPGNHDKVWKGRGKWENWVPAYEEAGFTILNGQEVINIGEIPVLLCHFPYAGVSKGHGYDDKFSGVRPTDNGGWLVCGHVHQNWTVKNRMINVGVDVWDYHPVPERRLIDIIIDAERASAEA